MKNALLIVLSCCLLAPLFAQETTFRPEQEEETPVLENEFVVPSKILVIPYDPRLYMSNIDSRISEETGLSAHQIKNRMRIGLNRNVVAAANSRATAVTLLESEDPEVAKDLSYIYNSIGYKYIEVPVETEGDVAETEEKGMKKLANKFTRLTEGREDQRYEGQQEQEAEPDRYMNTIIHNPNLLQNLAEKYETQYFIFINQMDISSEIGVGGYSYATNKAQRKVKVHYTLFNAEGQEIYGGAAVVYFPSKVNDLGGIITGYFPSVAEIIVNHLPENLPPGTTIKRADTTILPTEAER